MFGIQFAVYPSTKKRIQYFPWYLTSRRLLVVPLVKICLHDSQSQGVECKWLLKNWGHREHCTENEGQRWEVVDSWQGIVFSTYEKQRKMWRRGVGMRMKTGSG